MVILRVLIVAVILGSIGLRYKTLALREATDASFDISNATYQIIAASGAEMHDNPVRPPKILSSVIYFREAGCEAIEFAMPISISVDMDTYLFRLGKPEYSRVVHFFDRNWPAQDRVAQRAVWLYNYTMTILGLSDNHLSQDAIVVGGPPACLDKSTIDWPSIWRQHGPKPEEEIVSGLANADGTGA